MWQKISQSGERNNNKPGLIRWNALAAVLSKAITGKWDEFRPVWNQIDNNIWHLHSYRSVNRA